MSIIKCPECGNEISDKSHSCIHCGFPLEENKNSNTICIINGVRYDLSSVKDTLTHSYKNAFLELNKMCKKSLSIRNCTTILDYIKQNGYAPETYVSTEFTKDEEAEAATMLFSYKDTPKVSCPYCGSSKVKKLGSLSRMTSIGIFGFGSGKIGKQWHCKDCNSDF